MPTTLPTYTGYATSLLPLTGTTLIDALIVGSKWGVEPTGNGASLTVSLPTSLAAFDVAPNVPGNYNPNEVTQSGFSDDLQGFSAFSPEQQAAARAVQQSAGNAAAACRLPDSGSLRKSLVGCRPRAPRRSANDAKLVRRQGPWR